MSETLFINQINSESIHAQDQVTSGILWGNRGMNMAQAYPLAACSLLPRTESSGCCDWPKSIVQGKKSWNKGSN